MYGRIAIGILFAAGIAAAQAAQNTKPTIAEQLRGGTANQQLRTEFGKEGTAGPGYIQGDFFKALRDALKEEFGEKRGAELYQHLMQQNLTGQEVMDLMNGKGLTESKLMKLFGATRDELDRLRVAIQKALSKKNRALFFGILIQVELQSGTTDGTVLKQTADAADQMSDADLAKLLRGTVSTSAIQSAFGLADKGSCKQMQDALNAMQGSPMLNHPMCESLGMGKGAFKPEDCGKLEEGMPGSEEEYADGEAAGFAFDPKLPPLPFAGENMGFVGMRSADDPSAVPEGGGSDGGTIPAGG